MKKAIITKRIVSIFLSSITAFMLPSQAFATNLSDKNIKYSSFDDIQGNGEKVANIVMELEEERTENTKLFLLDDGSKMLAEYTEPIHYKNDNNDGQNIIIHLLRKMHCIQLIMILITLIKAVILISNCRKRQSHRI